MNHQTLNVAIGGLLLLLFFSGWSNGLEESSSGTTRCNKFPKKFQSSFGKTGVNRTECSGRTSHDSCACDLMAETGVVHVDYERMRVRIDLHTDPFSKEFSKTVLLDFESNIQHWIDHQSRKCESMQIDSGYSLNNDFPEGSRYLTSGMIGGQMVEMYQWKSEKCNGGFSVTRSTCHIVSGTAIGKIQNKDKTTSTVMFNQFFWNFVPDVPPLVLEVPDICEHKPQMTKHAMTGPFWLWM